MNAKRFVVMFGIATSILFAVAGRAQTLTNLAGTWNVIYFGTPAQLTAETAAQGVVTNVIENSAFIAGNVQVIVQPDGSFSNMPGNFSIGAQGVVDIHVPDDQIISSRINSTEDVMAGISLVEQIQELDLLLRAPETLSTNDLVGTWNLLIYATPQQLAEVTVPTTNGSALVDLLAFDGNSVTNTSFAQIGTGTMTFNPDGTLSAALGDTVAGTFSIGVNGQFQLLIDSDDPFSAMAFINASKDVAFALHTEPAFNRQELIMLTRAPAAVTPADLQGAWKITTFGVPQEIALAHNSGNFVTAIDAVEDFEMDQIAYAQGHDGFLTGILDDEPSIGSVSIGPGGAVTVTITNTSGASSHSGFVSASKNTILMVEPDGGNYTLNVLTRAPEAPGQRQDFGLILYGTNIYWASGANRVLQSSSAPVGASWSDIPGTAGQHGFQPAYTNSAEFYRLSQ